MKTELTFGQIITSPQPRDAVHVAVAPVTAMETLYPAQHVSLASGSSTQIISSGPPVGIVDPFLRHPVMEGQQCWLFLYPQTITGLRHEWTHPAFAATDNAKSRLEQVAKECGVSYERMISAVESGDYIHMGENESYKNVLEAPERYAQFAKDCSEVLGKEVGNPYPFSCSC